MQPPQTSPCQGQEKVISIRPDILPEQGKRMFAKGYRIFARLIVILLVFALSLSVLAQTRTASSGRENQTATNGPATFKTAPTGTVINQPARNAQYICIPGLPPNITLTKPDTPWVSGLDVVVSKIPYVEGTVDWGNIPSFKTWVEGSERHFKGNGIPNHSTGIFPVQKGTAAYDSYSKAPAPPYSSAAEIPIAQYDLDITVPANPIYSERPSCINALVTGVVTQTGAPWHANIAYADVWVDPIAGLPVDQCWGHPYNKQYHYHGYSWKCLPNQGSSTAHSPLYGYAMDGFGVFGPLGDNGKPLTNNDLDECHGHVGKIEWDGVSKTMYHYHVNNEYPYGPGCYRGAPADSKTSTADHSHGFPPADGPLPIDGAPKLSRRDGSGK
jgi:hypothetical protein